MINKNNLILNSMLKNALFKGNYRCATEYEIDKNRLYLIRTNSMEELDDLIQDLNNKKIIPYNLENKVYLYQYHNLRKINLNREEGVIKIELNSILDIIKRGIDDSFRFLLLII